MNHWITVHWPHPVGGELPWNVYLRERHRSLADDLQPGDLVLFYRTAEAFVGDRVIQSATRIATGESGPLTSGPGGLIGHGVVQKRLESRPRERTIFRYGENNPYEWYEARCETTVFPMCVSHKKVKSVLGYGMRFRGGLREISREKYDALLRTLRSINGMT